MVLKRLEITGFKSFATRTVFEFRPGVTAIVGPNGSGKSNFSDAVRWVLGEQSLSQLRCRKPEELLYGGGGRRPAAGLAEVALTIDNSARLLPLDFDEVTITRRLVRSGENEYFINRARVRLRDVQTATAPLGGSYALIHQGLVDAVLSLKPEERRRLFEDAAEIAGYEQRKQDALRRLREAAANLVRVDDVLAELEPRLRALKRQATQAEQYRTLQDQLQLLRTNWHRAQWRDACQRRDLARTTADTAVAALAGAEAMQRAADLELVRLREIRHERRGALRSLLERRAALTTDLQESDRALAISVERERSLVQRRADLDRQRADAALTERELEQQCREIQLRVQQTDGQMAESDRQTTAAEAALQPAADAVQRAQQLWRTVLDAGVKQARDLAALRSQIEQVEQQVRRSRQARDALLEQQAALQPTLERAAQQVLAAEQRERQAQTQLTEALDREQSARRALADARTARAAADEERAQVRRDLGDLQARLETMTRLQRANAGVFAGVKAALDWAARQARPGFALVQHVIETPAEYETAVEVALGARLQQIIVDHWRDAEDAIAELRRSGAGRATFLPLDTLRAGRRESRRNVSADGVFGVAADLVRMPDRYELVREQLLGRLLLVRDLPTARREVQQVSAGWQIVTLSGEMVSSGGSVSGGAPIREQGALRRERETRELPAQIAAAEAQLRTADQRRARCDSDVQQAQSALQAAEQAIQEGRRRTAAAIADLDRARRQVESLSHDERQAAGRRAELERDGSDAARRLLLLQEQLAQVEQSQQGQDNEQQTLQQAVETARREEQQLRDRVSRARADRTALQSRRQTSAQDLQSAQRRLAQLREAAGRHETLAAELDRSAAVLADEVAALRTRLDETRRAQQQLQQVVEPLDLELAQIDRTVSAAEAQLQQAAALLLAAERQAAQAQSDAQRAVDRADAVFERAVADGVDPEQAADDQSDALPVATAGELDELRQRLARLGTVNLLALEEYRELTGRHSFLTEQSADLRAAEATVRTLIADLDGAMHDRFQTTFTAVAAAFSLTFPRLFGGGSAQLQLVQSRPNGEAEPEAPISRAALGVEVLAQPPGKRRQPISVLSGGERSLTAVALLFAILQVNPSPFCILDETDAALDESNVGRFREVLTELTGQTQFILITHNRGTVETADHLYGVTLADDGSSRIVSLQIAQYVKDHA